MAGPKTPPPQAPVKITWTEIHGGGREVERTGHVWAPARPWRGARALWVIPTPDGPLEMVLTAATRRRCDRVTRGGDLVPGSGRFVEIGERYTDPWSRAGAVTMGEDHRRRVEALQSSRKIDGGSLPTWLFEALSGEGDPDRLMT